MRNCFTGHSTNDVWLKAVKELIFSKNEYQDSRAGKIIELQHVSFNIDNPRQRWVYSRQPAINPAFAIVEFLMIMSGSNQSHILNYWNPALPKYAGHGDTYYGAYGYRLRNQFGFDQIEKAYETLKNNPNSRQVVLQIWDPRTDLPFNHGLPNAEDIPCNICSMLKVRNGKLDWLQIMRSNDLYRGTPYNFVQFTSMQEILSGWLGLEVGTYCQVCDSLHVYKNDLDELNYSDNIDLSNILLNNDNISVSKDLWDKILAELINILALLSSDDLQRKDVKSIFKKEIFPKEYVNLISIVVADCARRRNWYEEIACAISHCSNQLLIELWKNWSKRLSAH